MGREPLPSEVGEGGAGEGVSPPVPDGAGPYPASGPGGSDVTAGVGADTGTISVAVGVFAAALVEASSLSVTGG